MKKNPIYFAFVCVVIFLFLFFGANSLLAQISFPTISVACETKSGYLYSFKDGFSSQEECTGKSRRVILIGEKGEKGDKGDRGDTGPRGEKGDPGPVSDVTNPILDIEQVRGSGAFPQPEANVSTPTSDLVTVNCDKPCHLWVNYDVDTRNSQQAPWPQGWTHLYHIYVDGVDQAVYNQASFPVPNVAVPLAVNGVFPVSEGEHTVQIWVKKNGGTLEQFTSHLQVMAIGR